MVYLRWLLLPFSLLFAFAVWLRNRLYDRGWLRQTAFALPVIVIGNLEVGGTGKTPMTEYLIRLLSSRYRVATLSRGYGRKTRGYREVHTDSISDESGDEPLQFKQKFPSITVAVDENRVRGVGRLQERHDLLLLDDAFQHRALRPGLSILLFDFGRLSRPHFLLPAGDYRDCFGERRRADIVVVTKCPPDLGETQRRDIVRQLSSPAVPDQPILFAHTVYGDPVLAAFAGTRIVDGNLPGWKNAAIVLVTGIARPQPLLQHCQTLGMPVSHLEFPDHHRFSAKDLALVRRHYSTLEYERKIIVTTEKDAKRLSAPGLADLVRDLPLYYIPIRLAFHVDDQDVLDDRVLTFAADRIIASGASAQP